MADRIQRLNQLNEWLDAGRIDQSEYEALKRELFAAVTPEPETMASLEVPRRVHNEVLRLREETYRSLGVTREELEEVDRAGFNILQGTEVFTKGVEAHTRMLLSPDRDLSLRSLVEMSPTHLPMPIYLGVTQTIEVMLEQSEGVALPLEVRGFMATYAMLTWEWLIEAGIDFEPGEANMPDELFKRLGLGVDTDTLTSDGPRRSDGLLPGGFLPDDAPLELYVKTWQTVPFHGFLVQKLEGQGYEWRRSTTDNEGTMVVVARGVERSERKAEEQRDSQIAELAIDCVHSRDTALRVASQHGFVPQSHYPSFLWGPVDDVDERGYAIPMGIGIRAKFGDYELPLARLGHHELARKLMVSLAVVTSDERGVQELMAEEAQRQWVKSLIRQSRRHRT